MTGCSPWPGPATSRIRLGAAETVLARIHQTSVPNAIADPALRRLTSAPARPALKAAVRRAAGASVAQQVAVMVQTLVKATAHPEAIDPNRYVPDGILGSKKFKACNCRPIRRRWWTWRP